MTEYLGKLTKVTIDRPIGSRHPLHEFLYPVNYGYIENTISGDGEEIDAYVLGETLPVETFEGIVIGIVKRLNDSEDKLRISFKSWGVS